MKRQTFQRGSVERKKRASGLVTWVLRYRDPDGTKRSQKIGTLKQYPTKAAAEKQAEKIRATINGLRDCVTVADLIERFKKEGMPERESSSGPYRSYLKRIGEKWGDTRIDELTKNVMGIETWINALKTEPKKTAPVRPLSMKTRSHLKAVLHRMVEHAMKWGALEAQRNPIGLVELKGRSGRVRKLVMVTVEQYQAIVALASRAPHVRVMVILAMNLGLRASELLGLRWEDVDFTENIIHIRRSVVGREEGETKTLASAEQLPLHPQVSFALQQWRMGLPSVNGWLFGNPVTGRPWWRDSLQTDHLEPAGRAVGVKGLGWHAFRHSYRAMLRELELPLEVQQQLMRHADVTTTTEYGGKTPMKTKRSANSKVVELVHRRPA